jgi:hypothetical protein
MFRTVPLSIIGFPLYTLQWYMSNRFADNLRAAELIYLLTAIGLSPGGSSTVHIYTQPIYTTQITKNNTNSCLKTCMTYTTAVCTVKNVWWWTEELSETCRVSFQNKFEKFVHLVGFIIRKSLLTLYAVSTFTSAPRSDRQRGAVTLLWHEQKGLLHRK